MAVETGRRGASVGGTATSFSWTGWLHIASEEMARRSTWRRTEQIDLLARDSPSTAHPQHTNSPLIARGLDLCTRRRVKHEGFATDGVHTQALRDEPMRTILYSRIRLLAFKECTVAYSTNMGASVETLGEVRRCMNSHELLFFLASRFSVFFFLVEGETRVSAPFQWRFDRGIGPRIGCLSCRWSYRHF